jgi:aminodeoxyfutalosine deaminase
MTIQADVALTYRLAEDGEGWELLCLPHVVCEIYPETGRIASLAYGDENNTTPESEMLTILTPGLINGHTHLELNPPEPMGLSEGESMADWLIRVATRYRDRDEGERIADAKVAAKELLSRGCTGVNDVSTSGASISALRETGLRGRVGLEFFHPDPVLDKQRLEVLKALLSKCFGAVNDTPWVTMGLAPHSPYNVSAAVLTALSQELPDIPVQLHMAESADEMAWFRGEKSGINTLHQTFLGRQFSPEEGVTSPFQRIPSAVSSGNNPWVLVHGNYLTASELTTMADWGLGLVHCPVSNDVLKHHPLNLDTVDAAGVAWCFGTDGRVSNAQLDLRAEARLAMSRGLSAEDAFFALTVGAAEVLGWDTVGELSTGNEADMVLWRAPKRQDIGLLELLMLPETRVDAVWVAGQKRFEQ